MAQVGDDMSQGVCRVYAGLVSACVGACERKIESFESNGHACG